MGGENLSETKNVGNRHMYLSITEEASSFHPHFSIEYFKG